MAATLRMTWTHLADDVEALVDVGPQVVALYEGAHPRRPHFHSDLHAPAHAVTVRTPPAAARRGATRRDGARATQLAGCDLPFP